MKVTSYTYFLVFNIYEKNAIFYVVPVQIILDISYQKSREHLRHKGVSEFFSKHHEEYRYINNVHYEININRDFVTNDPHSLTARNTAENQSEKLTYKVKCTYDKYYMYIYTAMHRIQIFNSSLDI